MATTITPETAQGPAQGSAAIPNPGPNVADAFVADRQAFWGSFTSFVMVSTVAIVVLLIVMAIFLT